MDPRIWRLHQAGKLWVSALEQGVFVLACVVVVFSGFEDLLSDLASRRRLAEALILRPLDPDSLQRPFKSQPAVGR